MVDAVDETEKLLARASAAIAEAARLAEESYHHRKSLGERIRFMRYNAAFYPKSLKIYSPLDFLAGVGPRKPYPNEIIGKGRIETNGDELIEGEPIFDPHVDSSD